MNNLDKSTIRGALCADLIKREPNYVITFNFGYPIKSVPACNAMNRFFDELRNAYPDAMDNSSAFGFLEHPLTNPHYHTLVNLPPSLAKLTKRTGTDRWKKIMPRGQFHILSIKYPKRAISYCTKNVYCAKSLEEMFVYGGRVT